MLTLRVTATPPGGGALGADAEEEAAGGGARGASIDGAFFAGSGAFSGAFSALFASVGVGDAGVGGDASCSST